MPSHRPRTPTPASAWRSNRRWAGLALCRPEWLFGGPGAPWARITLRAGQPSVEAYCGKPLPGSAKRLGYPMSRTTLPRSPLGPPERRRGRRQKNAELALGAPRGAISLPWSDNPANGQRQASSKAPTAAAWGLRGADGADGKRMPSWRSALPGAPSPCRGQITPPTANGRRPPKRQRRVPCQPGLKGQGMGFKTGKRAEGPKHIGD